MNIIGIGTVVTGLIPYVLLIKGIVQGTIKQSFATWLLWLLLDFIMLRGIIVQGGSPILYTVFTLGTFCVTALLIYKKQFEWGRFETFVTLLVIVCIVVYLLSGAYMATIATAAALSIAGIPQIVETYKSPESTSSTAYVLFSVSSILALFETSVWTVPDKLPQLNSGGYCLVVFLLSLRKPQTKILRN